MKIGNIILQIACGLGILIWLGATLAYFVVAIMLIYPLVALLFFEYWLLVLILLLAPFLSDETYNKIEKYISDDDE